MLCIYCIGWLSDLTGSYDAAFYVAGALIIVSGLMLGMIPCVRYYQKRHRRHHSDTESSSDDSSDDDVFSADTSAVVNGRKLNGSFLASIARKDNTMPPTVKFSQEDEQISVMSSSLASLGKSSQKTKKSKRSYNSQGSSTSQEDEVLIVSQKETVV